MASEYKAGRFNNRLPTNSTDMEKQEFANYCLDVYRKKEWKGASLSEYFVDALKTIAAADFGNLESITRRDIRDHLKVNGIYVYSGRVVSICTLELTVARE